MSFRFGESGGQYHESSGLTATGVWNTATGNGMTSSATARNNRTYAYGTNNTLTTQSLGASGYNGMVAGYAYFQPASYVAAQQLIVFVDNSNANQCDLRIDASGHLYFTRNGTTIGTSSSNQLPLSLWSYIEFKAAFSNQNTATGTCEARVNGSVWASSSSLWNAAQATGALAAKGYAVQFKTQNTTSAAAMDFYVCDTDTSSGGGTNPNNDYLGDVTVAEIYGNGAGTNSDWSQGTNNGGAGSPPPFAISSVTGGTAFTRTTTATGETAGAYIGYYFTTSGFTGSNGTFLCTNSSTTTITLSGSSLSGSGTLAFQCIVSPGIHGGDVDNATTNTGTRPNGDAAYVTDGTSGHKIDYVHQTFPLTGTIYAVVHVSCSIG